MIDESIVRRFDELAKIAEKHNQVLFKILDNLDEFDMRLKALEDKQKSVIKEKGEI